MTIEELSKLSDEELRVRCAELLAHNEWVIVKRGLYYRPNGGGYTSHISEAWKLPHAEAKKHEAYVDRKDVSHDEKVFIKQVPPPNYPADLNAMHGARATMTEDECKEFNHALMDAKPPRKEIKVPAERWTWGSSAREQCIAFIFVRTASNSTALANQS